MQTFERNQGGSSVKLSVANLIATDDHVAYTLTCTLSNKRRIKLPQGGLCPGHLHFIPSGADDLDAIQRITRNG